MCEFPNVFLDLSTVFVHVLDLIVSSVVEKQEQKPIHLGKSVLVELPYEAGKVGMSECLRPAVQSTATRRFQRLTRLLW